MAKPKIDQNKIDWHFSYWKDSYAELRFEYAMILDRAQGVMIDLQKAEKKMKAYEANRRQHAVEMGTTVHASDEVFNIDRLKQSVPDLLKEIREQFKGIMS